MASVPFNLFGGQAQGLVCLALALVLMALGTLRPALFDGARAYAQSGLAPTLNLFSRPFVAMTEGLAYLLRLTQLENEVERLQGENTRLQEWFTAAQLLQAENTSLRELLKVKSDLALTILSTRVIADAGGPYAQMVTLGAGQADGVAKGDVVIGGAGLAGRIVAVSARTATVLLLSDVNSRVPVRVGSGNLQAIVAGTSQGGLVIERVPEGSAVADGAVVVTSGVGGVFPPDLPVGVAENKSDGQLALRSYADFGRLMFVRVVRVPRAPESTGEK